jgi:hypothetical protein
VLVKVLIIIALLTILYSLFSALIFLVKDKGESTRTVRRLSWRIGLSLLLFLGIYFAYRMGWVEPGSSGPIRYGQPPVNEQSAEPPAEQPGR